MTKKKKTFRKYMKRGWHIITRSIEAIIAFCFVLSIMLFLRLLKGPIEIDFFTPILEKVFVQKGDQKFSVGMVFLELDAKHGHLCAVKATDIAIKNKTGEALVEIPKASFVFNLLPLLTGNFMPSSLTFEEPYLQTFVEEQSEGGASEKKAVSEGVLYTLGKLFSSLEDLDYFEIKKGKWVIDIKSVQKKVNIPDITFSIKKRGKFLLAFSGTVTLQEKGVSTPFELSGSYYTNTNLLVMDASFEDMPIKNFGTLLQEVKGTDLILSGALNAVLDMNAKTLFQIVRSLTVSAEASQKGSIYLPAPIDTTYFVDTLVFTGEFSDGLKSFEISDAIATIGEATVFAQMKMGGLDAFLDTGKTEKIFATLSTQAKNVLLSELPVLWPSQLGASAYEWVTENIKTGVATDASFVFLLQNKEMVDLKGTVKVKGATVDYLDGLPPVKGADAIVSFFPDKILIEANKGHVGNLKLKKANVDFLGLGKDVVPLQIIFTAYGPIKEGMDILSKKPLELVNFLNLDYKRMTGEGKATVRLDIPISSEFKSSDIGVRVEAELDNVSVPVPYTELSVNKGEGTLYADNQKINIKGHVLFDGNPFEVEWDHLFDENIKQPARGILVGKLSDKLLKPYYKDVSELVEGDISVRAEVLFQTPAFQQINVIADLKETNVFFDLISYTKEKGKPAVFLTTLETGNGQLLSVPSFRFEASDDKALIDGNISLKKGFTLNLKHIKTPQNDLSVFFKKKSDGVKISVQGKKLDISRYLHPQEKKAEETEKRRGKIKDFDIKVQLDELFLTREKPFKEVSLSLAKERGIYTKWDGTATSVSPFILKMGNNGKLLMETQDFGSFLNYTGYSDRIRGGRLKVEMMQEKGGLKGAFEMRDYALTKTPFFMQAVTILGILDAFKGDEIAFKKASIPFRLEENFDISIEDGVAYGTAVGVTFQGDIKSDEIALSGSVIPAYAVNSLPGKIPFIGRIFSGDKGGGLIGLAFEVKGETSSPELIFKPSSLLTPGFIRNIFN